MSLFTGKRQQRQQQFKLLLMFYYGAVVHPGKVASNSLLVCVYYILSLSAPVAASWNKFWCRFSDRDISSTGSGYVPQKSYHSAVTYGHYCLP